MTQCNSLNVKLSSFQHSRLKLATKNAIEVFLKLFSNMAYIIYLHKFLLTEHKFHSFVKPLQKINLANINYQKLRCLKKYTQGDLLAEFLNHY